MYDQLSGPLKIQGQSRAPGAQGLFFFVTDSGDDSYCLLVGKDIATMSFSVHEHEKVQLESLFRQQGIDRIEDRLKIVTAFFSADQHVTPNELADALARKGEKIDAGFVEDTLEQVLYYGFAFRHRFADGEYRYEHRHIGEHHDHLVCIRCGTITEFVDSSLEAIQERIADSHGFLMLHHRMELYGICSRCNAARSPEIPLASAKPGEKVVVRAVKGGAGMRLRLMTMGLRIGDVLEVLTNHGKGQVVVASGSNRLVLGRGFSRKILVAPRRDFDTIPAASGEHGRKREDTASTSASMAGGNDQALIPLSRMKEGAWGWIYRVGGEPRLRQRLLEMGLTRGTKFRVEKYAPLKDPLELVVRGAHISLRVQEADFVLVEPGSGNGGQG